MQSQSCLILMSFDEFVVMLIAILPAVVVYRRSLDTPPISFIQMLADVILSLIQEIIDVAAELGL